MLEIATLLDKVKNKIVSILVLLIAFMIAKNIYKSQSGQIEALIQQRDAARQKNQVLASLSTLESRVTFYKRILVKKDTSSTINTITNMAKESGIQVVSIKPEPEQRYTDYIKLSFSLVANAGSYHAIGRFISKVEGYKEIYMVDALEIIPDREGKKLTATLIISSIAIN